MGIRWLSSMEIGVDLVDNQHKELVDRVNKLLEACENKSEKADVEKILLFLKDYVVEHFTSEQELMVKYNYPGYEEHLGIHKKFTSDFLELKSRFDEEGLTTKIVTELNELCVNWLVKHIAEVDTKMGAYLEEHM